jgi:hypothetical protein
MIELIFQRAHQRIDVLQARGVGTNRVHVRGQLTPRLGERLLAAAGDEDARAFFLAQKRREAKAARRYFRKPQGKWVRLSRGP